MEKEQIKFLKSNYKLEITPYIYLIGDSSGNMISRFNTLYFKVIKDENYFIIELIN